MTGNKSENQPATKGDVALVKTELRSDIKRLEDIVKTNTIDILHIKDDIRDMRETMATKSDINRIMNAVDRFGADAIAYRNQDTLRGQAVMDHTAKLSDHETRIQKLETTK
ncbi:MAG: hypothetical protein A2270_05295 [Elusimicrobia bacterium RIFOXYA12_FULL_51_18]|nr:MAG: hypothetical protein A2270_05295 [Elusimicrobia bacterium RIFOXYA12_FULL_51_18]OGS28759.1 MAG: hypothetical protein A2218_11370 [Elusimicrobia bacterium RIFOXYA2_FULL_53_38]